MRRALVAAGALVLFAGFALRLFPIDDVARRVLSGIPSPVVTFGHAGIRPTGIRLDDVTMRVPEASLTLHADHAYARPSLVSLVRGGDGLPWRILAVVCGGDVDATVAADPAAAGTAVTLAFDRADLSNCPPLAIAGGALAGRAGGTARLRLPSGAPPEGDGAVQLRDAVWQNPADLPLLGTLHAESASVRWRLAQGLLALEGIELTGPDLSASGSGELRFAEPVTDSAVTIRLALVPGAHETGFLQLMLPPSAGTRNLFVGGRLVNPQVSLQ